MKPRKPKSFQEALNEQQEKAAQQNKAASTYKPNRIRTLSGKCPGCDKIVGDRTTLPEERCQFCPRCGKRNPWLELFWMATMPDGNHAFISADACIVADLLRFFEEAAIGNGAIRFEKVDYGSLPSLEGM